ncbi:hypothetical protein QE370_000439 [Aeromicrobium sp. SORGH_AS981]|uniref:hypothetical protein n=1 Tax=Aeromicrobium sp. SORGH_AS_0981 TaxID=3041802 RepID=UPI00285E07E3|nr:hypothetical protein [Aeromicrobium sp. SORGH_AS_0981]MDR6117255.1 hypothetical protein [Aeromicrobium sp. SORGH_AS_0981]
MSVVSHSLDVYGVDLHLANTRRDWSTISRRLGVDRSLSESAGGTVFLRWEPAGGGRSVPTLGFWISPDLSPLDHVETCAHEAAHAATLLLTWVGHDVRGTDGHDEPSAYLAGWLTRWLWENTAPGTSP